MTPFSDFYVTLRAILGDNDPYSNFEFQNDALDGALRSVFLLGTGPDGYLLVGDRQSGNQIDPEIPNGDPFALISYEAAMLLIGGGEGSLHYHTRGISVTRSGDKQKTLMAELRTKIYAITNGGENQFASVQSFQTWLYSITGDGLLGEVLSRTPAPSVGILSQINLGVY